MFVKKKYLKERLRNIGIKCSKFETGWCYNDEYVEFVCWRNIPAIPFTVRFKLWQPRGMKPDLSIEVSYYYKDELCWEARLDSVAHGVNYIEERFRELQSELEKNGEEQDDE